MANYIVGIGAANVDIYGKSSIKIKPHYDHPSIIKTTVGGVTRNVLENASRLGVECKLLTAVGDDLYGDLVLSKSKEVGIDVDNVLVCKNERTGIFMQVQDSNNDMHLALCDMSISKNIDIDYINSNREIIKNANALVLDPSLDNEVIEYILNEFKIPVFVDPISDMYAKKFAPYLRSIYCVKPNCTELFELVNSNDLNKAFMLCVKNGVSMPIVSLGKDGLMYLNDAGEVKKRAFKPVEKMVNASGAGDSVMACLLYGFVNKLNIEETIDLALAAGIATVMSQDTINSKMSVELLRNIIKENKEYGF